MAGIPYNPKVKSGAQNSGAYIRALRNWRENHPYLDMAAGFLPGVGQAQAIDDIAQAIEQKDPIKGALAAASMVPVSHLVKGLKNPPKAEAISYHGSPHSWKGDKPDPERRLTGEGSMEEGAGLYTGTSAPLAMQYAAVSPAPRSQAERYVYKLDTPDEITNRAPNLMAPYSAQKDILSPKQIKSLDEIAASVGALKPEATIYDIVQKASGRTGGPMDPVEQAVLARQLKLTKEFEDLGIYAGKYPNNSYVDFGTPNYVLYPEAQKATRVKDRAALTAEGMEEAGHRRGTPVDDMYYGHQDPNKPIPGYQMLPPEVSKSTEFFQQLKEIEAQIRNGTLKLSPEVEALFK